VCEVCGKKRPKIGERAQQVLELAARGFTDKQIATQVGITEKTVNYHIARLKELLDMSNRVSMVVEAHLLGLIKLGGK